ncbi:UNVERIFIED_CONTAM: hypothetical protein FKN15_022190 [Acipenser sinensis]
MRVVRMCGSDERPFQLTVEKLEKGLEDAKQEGISVRVMILINPHNPLGEIYTPTEMKEFLEFAKRHELHAIVDEVYMLSVFDESATFHSVLTFNKIPDPQRTHVMWGISKDFAASRLRVGTLYSENKHVIDALGQMAYFHRVPGTTQHQVAHLLHDRGMQRLREVLDDRNLDNQLDGLKKSSQSEEKMKPSPSQDKKKPSQSEERRSLGKSEDKKTAVHSGPDHALDCSNDDIVEDTLQSAPSTGGLIAGFQL